MTKSSPIVESEVKDSIKRSWKTLRALRRRLSDVDPKKPDALQAFQEARAAARKITLEART